MTSSFLDSSARKAALPTRPVAMAPELWSTWRKGLASGGVGNLLSIRDTWCATMTLSPSDARVLSAKTTFLRSMEGVAPKVAAVVKHGVCSRGTVDKINVASARLGGEGGVVPGPDCGGGVGTGSGAVGGVRGWLAL